MEHLVAADEAVAVEVVDPEAEGRALVGVAPDEDGQAEQPLVEPKHAVVAAVERAEHAVHEHFFGHQVESVVEDLPENHAIKALETYTTMFPG